MFHDKMKADEMSKTERGIALVTGASSGIGLVTAQALRRDGFRVFGTSRKPMGDTADGITMLALGPERAPIAAIWKLQSSPPSPPLPPPVSVVPQALSARPATDASLKVRQ